MVIGAHPLAQDMSPYRKAIDSGIERWLQILETEVGPLSDAARRRQFANDVYALRACVAKDRQDRSAQLASSTASIFAITGALDPLRPLIQRFAVEYGVEYVELDNLGHVATFLAVNEVLAHLERFVERLEASEAHQIPEARGRCGDDTSVQKEKG